METTEKVIVEKEAPSTNWAGVAIFITTIGLGILIAKKAGLFDDPDKNNPAGSIANEAQLKAVQATVNPANLKQAETYYKQLAINQYEYLHPLVSNPIASANSRMFSELENLNVDELKTVFVHFGYAERKLFNEIITLQEGNLFQWYTNLLNSANLTKMQGIWAKTGLWVDPASSSSTYNRTGIITNPIVNSYTPKVGDKIRGKSAGIAVTAKAESQFASGNKTLLTLTQGQEMIINKNGRVNNYYAAVRIPKDWIPYYWEETGYMDLFNSEIIPQKISGVGKLPAAYLPKLI